MFEKFNEIYTNRHDYAKEWKKRAGGKVVGYFCTYAPEEIMYAANILPVRILGSHEATSAAATRSGSKMSQISWVVSHSSQLMSQWGHTKI